MKSDFTLILLSFNLTDFCGIGKKYLKTRYLLSCMIGPLALKKLTVLQSHWTQRNCRIGKNKKSMLLVKGSDFANKLLYMKYICCMFQLFYILPIHSLNRLHSFIVIEHGLACFVSIYLYT